MSLMKLMSLMSLTICPMHCPWHRCRCSSLPAGCYLLCRHLGPLRLRLVGAMTPQPRPPHLLVRPQCLHLQLASLPERQEAARCCSCSFYCAAAGGLRADSGDERCGIAKTKVKRRRLLGGFCQPKMGYLCEEEEVQDRGTSLCFQCSLIVPGCIWGLMPCPISTIPPRRRRRRQTRITKMWRVATSTE